MKIKIKGGVIFVVEEGLDDRAIGSLFPVATETDEKIIECGTESVDEIKKFVEDVRSGSFKPRKAVKVFEDLLEKHELIKKSA